MFLTADALLCHLVGDYLLQSDWQAQEKTKSSVPAAAHALSYSLPFLFITRSLPALAFIILTHFLIDRFRLARYVCWAKNFLAPKWLAPTYRRDTFCAVCVSLTEHDAPPSGIKACRKCGTCTHMDPSDIPSEKPMVRNYMWSDCVGTGYHKDRPMWLSVWLLIICDNTCHLICNGIALTWL